MRTVTRRRPAYRWLVAVLAADVLGLTALLLNQSLDWPAWRIWSLAAVVSVTALPWLLRLSDEVFSAARRGHTIPLAGEKSP